MKKIPSSLTAKYKYIPLPNNNEIHHKANSWLCDKLEQNAV